MEKWTRARYQPCLPLGDNGSRITGCERHIALSRKAAQEGIVLLKNENKNLPLNKNTKIAIFGKAQFDYVPGGNGSGNVFSAYTRNIYEGLKLKGLALYEELSAYYHTYTSNCYKNGEWVGRLTEPEISDELVGEAAEFTDTAIITISRFSTEGGDFTNDDYYLSDNEAKMVKAVCEKFKHITVLLNTGAMLDTSWFVNEPNIESALQIWLGGIEGGLAVADILTGEVNPSGKLADTCADSFDSYPSSTGFYESDDYVQYTEDIFVGYRYFATIPKANKYVVYPFGYGLSYTNFDITDVKLCDNGEQVFISVKVTNVGEYSGKEVVQVYSCPSEGEITKPKKELRAFAKTPLLEPGESYTVTLSINIDDMAVYDDLGQIQKSAYVLEKGEYRFVVGNSSASTNISEYVLCISENKIVKQLTELCPPRVLRERLNADGRYSPAVNTDRERLTFDCGYTAPDYKKTDETIVLSDVAEDRADIDSYIAQFAEKDLAELVKGQPNLGIANTCGIGAAKIINGTDEGIYTFKGLNRYGVPRIMAADGPAGLRLHKGCGIYTTAFPVAAMLAATWNVDIVEEIGKAVALEIKENNIGIWLAPALNIHRNPLCGRNYEYYSEDPFLTGKMAAAMVRGVQSCGIVAVPKHFACNNKETNRFESDSVVSERALREIYIKGFEICVKESKPKAIMTAYNKVNGTFASENAELIMGILRGEWGFRGLVMSDWANKADHIKEIKAGNDVRMPDADDAYIVEAIEKGKLSRSELAACARRTLEMIIDME